MKKVFKVLLLSLLLLFPATTAMAAVNDGAMTEATAAAPVIYQSTITVDEDGGRFQVGFINVEFKKSVLNSSLLPATFDAQIYAENGQVYIEFTPDSPDFYKNVHLRVDAYQGYIYDRELGENIYVNIKKDHILAGHFSRYAVGY